MSWTFESNPDSSLGSFASLLEKDTNTKGSFSEDYQSFCKDNKILPCPYITAVAVNSTQECCRVQNGIIDLSSWRAMLLAASTVGSKVVEISVHSCQITAQHLLDLAKALEKMGSCPIVKLQYLYLLITEETTAAFSESLRSLFSDATCVEYLSLKGSRFGSSVLQSSVSALSNNYKLRCLNLSDNDLNDDVVVELFKSIKMRTNLNEISLAHNCLTGRSLSSLTSLFNGSELSAEDEAAVKSAAKALGDKNKAIKEANKKRKKAGYPEVAECSPSSEVVTSKDKKSYLTNRFFNLIDLSFNPLDDSDSLSSFYSALESSPSSAVSNSNGEKIVISLEKNRSNSSVVRSVELDWVKIVS